MEQINHKFSLPKKFSWFKFVLQIIFWLILIYFAYILLVSRISFVILDNFNLLLHEAGHFLFSLFGEFMGVIGGTVVQLALPLIFIIYFFYRAQFYSGSIVLFWLGQSLIDISNYIKDASAMKLELIGDIHDWNYLLGKFNLLKKDLIMGDYVFALAAFIIVAALLFGLYALLKEYKLRNK